jgi:hypothetical protein
VEAAVESHSGYTYAERPTAVIWEGQRLPVAEILERRRAPSGPQFRVRTQDDQVFELFYQEASDQWSVERV